MGVFKNDVGRPSNKTIMIRNILKAILLIIVMAAIFAGGYLLNDYQNKDNKITKSGKKTVNKEVDLYKKYKDVKFVRENKVGGNSSYFIYNNSNNDFINTKLEILDGKLVISTYDDNENQKDSIKAEGINSKIKYLTSFNKMYYGISAGPVAVLTEDNILYIGDYNDDKKSFEFTVFEKNIVDMAIITDDNFMHDNLYLLDEKGNLRLVKYDEKKESYKLTNDLYENRYVYLGNYHEGGISYNILIHAQDNTIYFDEDFSESNPTGISKVSNPIKFNKKNIIVNSVMINEDGETSSLYVITNDNYILKTKEDRYSGASKENCKDCYEFEYYNDSKVKDVKHDKKVEADGYENGFVTKITYENDKTEDINSYYLYQAN